MVSYSNIDPLLSIYEEWTFPKARAGSFTHDSHGEVPVSSASINYPFADAKIYNEGLSLFKPKRGIPPGALGGPTESYLTNQVNNDLGLLSTTPITNFPIPTTQWYNPDTEEVVDIGQEEPQYHSTIPMGHALHDPNRKTDEETGFFSEPGRRLKGFFTEPIQQFRDISDVPVMGSGIGAAASTLGPILASAAIPGAGWFSLLSRLLPDSQDTPYQQEGQYVTDISFGPNVTWLGANVPGGGYYMSNQNVDMAQLGGGRTPGGRGITGHMPQGLVDATYRVDPTGAASITSDDFGAPGVGYGDIYYAGTDYEGLDTGEDVGFGEDVSFVDYSDADWGNWI